MNAASRLGTDVLAALSAAVLMIAVQVTGKATRDALFLSHFDATDLPKIMIAAAIVSVASALSFSYALSRWTPHRVIPLLFGISAAALVGEWLLVQTAPRLGAIALYLHMAAFGAGLISGFWSVVNERFDPYSARATMARISAAAAFGGILGGLLAERVSALFGVPVMLLAMAGLHLAAGGCAAGIGAPKSRRLRGAEKPTGVTHGLAILRRTPYLRNMAGLVLLTAVVDALLDYALKSEAQLRFEDSQALIQFFAVFYTLMNLLTFVLQASAGARVLQKFGLGISMAAMPVGIIATGIVATAFTRMWSIALVRGMGTLAANSVFRAGFELLYTPLPPETKRPTKVYIDVGGRRLGDLIGSGLILAFLAVLPDLSTSLVIAASVITSVGVLAAVLALQRGYVAQLASSLRTGVVSLDQAEIVDATTARTIAATHVALDRDRVLQLIRERQQESGGDAATPETPAVPLPVEGLDPDAARTVERVAALASGDPTRIRRALAERPADPRVAAMAVDLLARDDVADEAIGYLNGLGTRVTGLLVDALVDADQPCAVRRRVARILEVSDDARALEGLSRALRDGPLEQDAHRAPDEFEVRYHCAQAAARIVARHPDLRLPSELVHDAVRRELSVSAASWEHQGRRLAGLRQDSVLLERSSVEGINRSLEHVFAVLSLAMEREVMASTLGSLHSEDENLRGTALEYLDVTLPPDVARALVARLDTGRAAGHTERGADEIADELMKSSAEIVLDRSQLERR